MNEQIRINRILSDELSSIDSKIDDFETLKAEHIIDLAEVTEALKIVRHQLIARIAIRAI